MGTRSLTVVTNEHEEEIMVLYRQFDGSLDGHGQELLDFLKPLRITDGILRTTNGISNDSTNIANGMGCLAAQIVAHFKDEVGGFYLYPAGTRDCGEELVYTVYLKEKILCLKIEDSCLEDGNTEIDSVIYDGSVSNCNL